MSNDETGVDFVFQDPLQEWPQVALYVRLPALDRQGFVHNGAEWDFIDEPAIDAWD